MDIWNWIGENSPQLGAFATIFTALIAGGTLLAARRESIARTQAYVIAYFDFAAHSNTTIELVIENIGVSMAQDISVEFDPPFRDPETYRSADAAGEISARFLAPLPELAPRQQLRNPWWGGTATQGNELTNRYSTSDLSTVTITYNDGVVLLRRLFTGQRRQHSFKLSLLPMFEQRNVTSSSSVPGLLATIAKSLKKLAERRD